MLAEGQPFNVQVFHSGDLLVYENIVFVRGDAFVCAVK